MDIKIKMAVWKSIISMPQESVTSYKDMIALSFQKSEKGEKIFDIVDENGDTPLSLAQKAGNTLLADTISTYLVHERALNDLYSVAAAQLTQPNLMNSQFVPFQVAQGNNIGASTSGRYLAIPAAQTNNIRLQSSGLTSALALQNSNARVMSAAPVTQNNNIGASSSSSSAIAASQPKQLISKEEFVKQYLWVVVSGIQYLEKDQDKKKTILLEAFQSLNNTFSKDYHNKIDIFATDYKCSNANSPLFTLLPLMPALLPKISTSANDAIWFFKNQINIPSSHGVTPLMLLIQEYQKRKSPEPKKVYFTLIQVLIDNGVDLTFKDTLGRTALDIAKQTKGAEQIIELLEQKMKSNAVAKAASSSGVTAVAAPYINTNKIAADNLREALLKELKDFLTEKECNRFRKIQYDNNPSNIIKFILYKKDQDEAKTEKAVDDVLKYLKKFDGKELHVLSRRSLLIDALENGYGVNILNNFIKPGERIDTNLKKGYFCIVMEQEKYKNNPAKLNEVVGFLLDKITRYRSTDSAEILPTLNEELKNRLNSLITRSLPTAKLSEQNLKFHNANAAIEVDSSSDSESISNAGDSNTSGLQDNTRTQLGAAYAANSSSSSSSNVNKFGERLSKQFSGKQGGIGAKRGRSDDDNSNSSDSEVVIVKKIAQIQNNNNELANLENLSEIAVSSPTSTQSWKKRIVDAKEIQSNLRNK